MTISVPADIQQFIDTRLATGSYATEDEVLRDAFRALQNEDEEVLAIQRAIDEWQQGDDGVPVDEAFVEIRKAICESRSA
jgi:putative addiction module CopG family antidote